MTTIEKRWRLWGTGLRIFCLYWFMGSLLALYLVALSEISWPMFSKVQAWLFCTVYLPIPSVCIGFWQWYKGVSFLSVTKHTFSDEGIVLLAVAVFVLWSSCYYLVAWISAEQPMKTLGMAADHWIPLWPATTFVYVSVQWFCMLSILVAGDVLSGVRIFWACMTAVFVCCVFFVAYPVEIRSAPVVVNSLSTWALSLVRGGDVTNNCFPSTHCAMVLLTAIFLFHKRQWMGWLGVFVALMIALSTLTTKQHYVLDVLGGLMVALVSYVFWFVWPRPKAKLFRFTG